MTVKSSWRLCGLSPFSPNLMSTANVSWLLHIYMTLGGGWAGWSFGALAPAPALGVSAAKKFATPCRLR